MLDRPSADTCQRIAIDVECPDICQHKHSFMQAQGSGLSGCAGLTTHSRLQRRAVSSPDRGHPVELRRHALDARKSAATSRDRISEMR
jgi:hypothetical protein